jgi:hypothetical protein
MAGLVPAIHVLLTGKKRKTWMPGMKPGMTPINNYCPALMRVQSRFISRCVFWSCARRT